MNTREELFKYYNITLVNGSVKEEMKTVPPSMSSGGRFGWTGLSGSPL